VQKVFSFVAIATVRERRHQVYGILVSFPLKLDLGHL